MEEVNYRQILNDLFRSSFTGGLVVFTKGVSELDEFTLVRLKNLVRSFDNFGEGDDPFGEHDFGAISLNGHDYFWKIDYFDLEMKNCSPDPNNPSVTQRVLTVMRSDEY